ncbi:MAG: hypothetical protein EPN93_20695 [Spirochaetes bacterium]|nr:MAG: hypothetical protein EPN93_20695 [Spirochaetota bacterium]
MKFICGNDEFGEFYHLAVAGILAKLAGIEFSVYVDNCEMGKHFLKGIGIEIDTSSPGKTEKSHLGETAQIIFSHYHTGAMKKITDKINEKAKDGKWESVVESKFTDLLSTDKKILIWIRKKTYCSHRNTNDDGIISLLKWCNENNLCPITIGEKIDGVKSIDKFYENDFYKEDCVFKQLYSLDYLYKNCNVMASLGVMSGAMDGQALIYNNKVIFWARESDAKPRMNKVSSIVPGLIWVPLEYTNKFPPFREGDLAELERYVMRK